MRFVIGSRPRHRAATGRNSRRAPKKGEEPSSVARQRLGAQQRPAANEPTPRRISRPRLSPTRLPWPCGVVGCATMSLAPHTPGDRGLGAHGRRRMIGNHGQTGQPYGLPRPETLARGHPRRARPAGGWSGVGAPERQSARPRPSDRDPEQFSLEICGADKGPRAVRRTFSLPMSAFCQITSASPPRADIPRPTLDFRF